MRCLLWATLCCLLYAARASDEDLLDFDFSDLKEIDWNYDSENPSTDEAASRKDPAKVGGTTAKKPLHENSVTFEDYDSAEQENQVRPFDWRENVLKHALAKALTNAALRQKFVEVMPILRVLSSQQRLALSALITAQINARKGQELKLEQVRMMFGDDKNLLIPIVYDIANLVGSSARKFLQFDEDLLMAAKFKQTPMIGRRNDELTTEEQAADNHKADEGTIAVEGEESLEDFFGDMPSDVLDPQAINEELQAVASKGPKGPGNQATKTNVTSADQSAKRSRRSAVATTTFVHKLIRSVPVSVNQQDLSSGAAGRTVKMNMTGFVSEPKTPEKTETTDSPPAYQAIEDLAFADLNGTMVNVTDTFGPEAGGAEPAGDLALAESNDEPLPSPEELIGGPRYRTAAKNGHLARSKVVAKRKRVQVRSRQKVGTIKSRPQETRAAPQPPSKKCERFTSSMCIRADDYPLDKIMGSIRRHKNAMNALLAEYYDKPTSPIDQLDDFDDFAYNKKRREDESSNSPSSPGSGGGMCQSIVRYARPQKARSASGEWKYIVNTGQHTQTLRLEKCLNPQESCSYLAQNYRSHCSQVYNYHRLLSWDKERGLHVDIFKVPTCCSCQVDGYRQQFPPLSTIKAKDFTPAYTPSDIYSTINEDLDYNDDDVDGDDLLSYQYDNGFAGSHRIGGGVSHHQKRHQADFDAGNELLLGSKNIRPQVYTAARPTVGSYLSPPEHDDYDTNFAASKKRASVPVAGSGVGPATRRRPYKSLEASSALHEARVDLDLAPSETYAENKEVNIFGSAHAKRKHTTHSGVPHSATTAGGGTGTGTGSTGTGTNTHHQHQQQQQPSTKVTHFHAPHQHSHHHQHQNQHQHQQHLGSGNGPHQHHHPHAYAKVSTGGGGNSGPGFGPLGSGAAANAHQKPAVQETGVAVPPAYYTNPGAAAAPPAPNQPGFGKAKPRFHANAAPPHPPAAAPPNIQQQQQPQQPQQQSEQVGGGAPAVYAVNSIFSSKYNTHNNNHNATLTSSTSISTATSTASGSPTSGNHNHGEASGSKRINYSYHPIIDFFENHRRSASVGNPASAPATGAGSQPPSGELLYPYTMPKSNGYRERRIGYGPQAGGGSGGGGGGGGNGGGSVERDNSWHPVVMES